MFLVDRQPFLIAGQWVFVSNRHAHESGPPRAAAGHEHNNVNREDRMKRQLAALLASGAFIASSGTPMAHHSFAMFDQENPIELVGTVQEFKYTNPHSYLLLEVKGPDGSTTVWNLEGRAPSLMARDGWTSGTLQPGDEIILTINPLRSGAPGGSWNTSIPKFKDGRPLRVTP
jgi:hypothetical protein